MKKVLLIVVDALASRVVLPAMEEGKLPNIRVLAQAGTLYLDSSAIFPSITPAATASIVTGRYPCDHGITGDHWYDGERDEIAYFGADLWVIWERGIDEFFEDFLGKLNHERLRADTLFQTVERAGLRAMSLNYIIFRGDQPHEVDIPFLLSLFPGVPFSKQVYGPALLRLGDFIKPDIPEIDVSLSSSGLLNRYGFEDQHTAQNLIHIARERLLPDFTLAYFPDNDFDSHAKGPKQAVTTLEQVDRYLGELIDVYGGLEPTLAELCIVLTGDHSQADMLANTDQAGIDLDTLLADFNVATAGTPWSSDDQLVICPNMRAACIYFRRPTVGRLTQVGTQLLSDPRIDQVIWAAEVLGNGARGYYVATRDRGRLHFWPGSDGTHTAVDQQGCRWSWEGDLRSVDGQVLDGVLLFPTYPNAFERIACALRVEKGGDLWVTAHPGYEFRIPGMNVHPGGSHGSLHALDSTSPLLLAGVPEGVELPRHPRSVDVAPLCLAVLGLETRYPVNASHI